LVEKDGIYCFIFSGIGKMMASA